MIKRYSLIVFMLLISWLNVTSLNCAAAAAAATCPEELALDELTIANQQQELDDIITDLQAKKVMLEQAPTWDSIDNIANYFIIKFRHTIGSFEKVKLFAEKDDAKLLKAMSDLINTFIYIVDRLANNPNKTDTHMKDIINMANTLIARSIPFIKHTKNLLRISSHISEFPLILLKAVLKIRNMILKERLVYLIPFNAKEFLPYLNND